MIEDLNKYQFEQMPIYPELIFIKPKGKERVIGYVNKNPYENGWFWFIDRTTSYLFNTKDEAIEDLIRNFIINKMDNVAKKIGTFENDKYTMGR